MLDAVGERRRKEEGRDIRYPAAWEVWNRQCMWWIEEGRREASKAWGGWGKEVGRKGGR